MLARVAVSGLTYGIDKAYDYLIPEKLQTKILPGMRVLVPFGKANRKREAMVLSIEDLAASVECKPILTILDDAPVLSNDGLRLAAFLRSRCFCTLFDAICLILPTGLSYRIETGYLLVQTDFDGATSAEKRLLDYFKQQNTQILYQSELNIFPSEFAWKKVADNLVRKGILSKVENVNRRLKEKTETICSLLVSSEEAKQYAALKRTGKMQRAVLLYLTQVSQCAVLELCRATGASRTTVRTLEKAGLLSISESLRYSNTISKSFSVPDQQITLSEQQEKVFTGLEKILMQQKASCALLQGITGSGKTLVYLKLIQHTIAQGSQAIVLVPEISLTPQITRLFISYFGDCVAVWHSGLSENERYETWKQIRSGNIDVVIGTRSAIFTPLNKIGLIVIDEEQEHTYKSENSPSYHTRDIAKFLCVQHNSLLLLCSATPSIDSRYRAECGQYAYFRLDERFNENLLPSVYICDNREELRQGRSGIIGNRLFLELKHNIDAKEQSILFLNRRGISRFLQCSGCGHVPSCVNCSVSLTYHAQPSRLLCHHCGYAEPVPLRCPVCGEELRQVGIGTEKVVQELQTLFPGTAILRMDADTTGGKNAHSKILNQFQLEKIPILVGTQMVTKGLDFADVTLVGVLNADLSLYSEDYRASERTFSMITQVIGRAGRGKKPGRAVLQTYSPDHPVIQFAARQDYDAFYRSEITLRKAVGAPPFTNYFVFTFFGADETKVIQSCTNLFMSCKNAILSNSDFEGCRILGPVPAIITRLHRKYHYQFTLCGTQEKKIRDLAARLMITFRRDPQNRTINLHLEQNP